MFIKPMIMNNFKREVKKTCQNSIKPGGASVIAKSVNLGGAVRWEVPLGT